MITKTDLLLQRAQNAFLSGQLSDARNHLLQLLSLSKNQLDALHLLGLTEAKQGDLQAADEAFSRAAALPEFKAALYLDWAEVHRRQGSYLQAERIFRHGIARQPSHRALLSALGHMKRDADERDDAALVFDHLLKIDGPDTDTLYTRAIIELESGRDATPYFRRTLDQSKTHPRVLLGYAAALHQQNRAKEAIALLEPFASNAPIWFEGLRSLARMRWDDGHEDFAIDYVRALKRNPSHKELWAAYLGQLASGLHFSRVIEELPNARRSAGNSSLFDLLEAQALSETGQYVDADRAFQAIGAITDPSFVPVKLRFLLRTGRADEAAQLGEAFTGSPSASQIWPLLGTAWRVTNDPRWRWLEQCDSTTAEMDLALGTADLDELTVLLRQLHTSTQHPYDQSARGGTQTVGDVLSRTDPPLTKLRATIKEAVANFIRSLPPHDLSHPFLGQKRGAFRFAGSWSIRLQNRGFHVSHVHPAGWISSAFYVSLPDNTPDSPEHAGWLKLGEPPPELETGLSAYKMVEPKPGRLVLFPSIMWHGTVPFPSGERLTCAFDVVPLEPR
jgi:cytochrome c-type biogenesis protein CcmH/NrfG